MTKVLVLGNSHALCMHRVRDEFSALFPSLETDFFCTIRSMLKRGKVDDTGTFVPSKDPEYYKPVLNTSDDSDEIDLTKFDIVFVVGLKGWPTNHLGAFQNFRLLDGEAKLGQGDQLMSVGLAKAILEQSAANWASEATKQFGTKANLVFCPAPAPSETISAVRDYWLKDACEALNAHLDAQKIVDFDTEAKKRAAAKAGFGYLPQPVETLALPFGTKAEFAETKQVPDSEEYRIRDHRHMNEAYGLTVLRAFAQQHLGLTEKVA